MDISRTYAYRMLNSKRPKSALRSKRIKNSRMRAIRKSHLEAHNLQGYEVRVKIL
jgi:hypothetical protein